MDTMEIKYESEKLLLGLTRDRFIRHVLWLICWVMLLGRHWCIRLEICSVLFLRLERTGMGKENLNPRPILILLYMHTLKQRAAEWLTGKLCDSKPWSGIGGHTDTFLVWAIKEKLQLMIPYREGWANSYWVFTVDQVLHRVLCQKPSH